MYRLFQPHGKITWHKIFAIGDYFFSEFVKSKLEHKKINLEKVISKIVFLESDGASINSETKSGLMFLFKEDYQGISFTWCSHRLELGLKNSLNKFIKPLDQSLIDLYYLYKKSSKKMRELKQLALILKESYVLENGSVHPEKACGKQWIDHQMKAFEKAQQ